MANATKKCLCETIAVHPEWKPDPHTANLLTAIGHPTSSLAPKPPLEVKWSKPDHPWLKMNIDGASKGNPGPSEAGGLFRDHLVNTVLGKAKPSPRISLYIKHILTLLHSLPSWKISHIYRDGNRAADGLANLGITHNHELTWSTPPIQITTYLNDDSTEDNGPPRRGPKAIPQRPLAPSAIQSKTSHNPTQQNPHGHISTTAH
ncbi:putative ribonuclease H protein [Acorus calamus]|uniref:Ribonuclease H protein n=1 Tax=Acorus calamus TaxID=4465 RepID=A0AAV9C4W4_ACOCL|nr:putative ribonuclease H protein [Acorus calamus]